MRKNQNGFTQHLASRLFWRRKKYNSPAEKDLALSAGFIPMLIAIVFILGLVLWLAFTHVLKAQK